MNHAINHTEYKDSAVGRTPASWGVGKIGDFLKIQGGNAFKSSDVVPEGIRWLKIANVQMGSIQWKEITYLPSDYKDEYEDYLLHENDIVIALTRPLLNGNLKVARLTRSDNGCLLNQRVGRLIAKSEVEIKFIYYLFQSNHLFQNIEKMIYGTDPPNISTKQIESIEVPVPPLSEQEKIASILNSVDEVIEKTESQISKLQDLKKGMMQELLTQGIGHTEFKDSPVGQIPVGWEVIDGNKIMTLGSGVSPSHVVFSLNANIMYMKVDDFNEPANKNGIVTTKLSFDKNLNLKVPIYEKGTIIIAKRGAAISKNRVQLLSRSSSVDTNLMTIQTKSNYNKIFLKYLFEFIELDSIADTTSIPQINNFHLYEMLFAKPPLEEQQKIASILSSIDTNIQTKQQKLQQTQNLKKSLMQDLLTGRVRVKVN